MTTPKPRKTAAPQPQPATPDPTPTPEEVAHGGALREISRLHAEIDRLHDEVARLHRVIANGPAPTDRRESEAYLRTV